MPTLGHCHHVRPLHGMVSIRNGMYLNSIFFFLIVWENEAKGHCTDAWQHINVSKGRGGCHSV